MTDVTFYHHERADGATRTGLTVDGSRALERFVPGDEERDPTLRWYVDVTFSSGQPPLTQEAAREWWVDHSAEVRSALEATASRLEVGIDMDFLPWRFEWPGPNGPARVSVSAMRRYAGVEVSRKISQMAGEGWAALSEFLQPIGEGVRAWPTA